MEIPEEEKRKSNENNELPWTTETDAYFDVHGPVFYPATALILIFIVATLWIGAPMEQVFTSVQSLITVNAGWFFVLVVDIFFLLMLYLGLSRYGDIRIGGHGAKPEFSTGGWFAMLFSAGMGIGIIFWGVAEPVYHFNNPPMGGEAGTIAAAETAMNVSFLHWGLHAWAIYALVGLALAFFTFNKMLPLSIRSVFYPVFGKRIHGPIGDIIDIIAVIATLFGLATSLGLGVSQINSGLYYLVGLPNNVTMQVILIGVITLMATGSVVLGIDKGVRVLSELNIRLAGLFLLFIIIVGPTLFILEGFVQNVGNYLQSFIRLSFWTETYAQTNWQSSWTVFYWAWWISWAPFVGMFIARVSYGRTIKQFILGVLVVPSLLTFLWLTAFGGSGIWLELNNAGNVIDAVNKDVSTALFQMLEYFPLVTITSTVGVLLIVIFFVTSSDSGSLVIDSITSGGKIEAPVGQRIFWAVTEGAVAAVLLIGGGLKALQTAAITTGLPFAFLLLLMGYSLMKGLDDEHQEIVDMEEELAEKSNRNMIRRMIERYKQEEQP